jgi:drug/metabolite transporter (DMT)-like permease
VTFWGLKYVVPNVGPWPPIFESRVASLALLPLFAAPLQQSIAPPPLRVWPMVVAIGLIDTFANAAYNIGIRSDVPGVVAVLGSLFSPVTVVLAFAVLRERVSSRQWLGVMLIFGTVAAIGIAEQIGA